MSLERGTSLETLPTDNAPTLVIGTVTNLPAGSQPTVTNSGTEQNAILDFALPQGATGGTGPQGNAGVDGANATNPNFTVGTVSSLPPGSTPTVTIDPASVYPNLILNFGLVRGDTGSGTGWAWGDGTGTLSAQTDLQNALNAKANTSALSAYLTTAAATTTYAPLADAPLIGNPTCPTQTAGDNSTKLANTAFVHNELASYAKLDGPALINGPTADGNLIGYRNLPTSRTISTTGATLADSDKGKKIVFTGSTAKTITINPNASTAIDADAIGTMVNDGTANVTIARGAGVSAKLMGTGADANRTIAPGGVATWMKTGTNAFYIGGPGVS